MMNTYIEGRYSRDLTSWVTFGTARLENAIRSISGLSGLVLTGTLTDDDWRMVCSKKDSLRLLDLRQAQLPATASREQLLNGAPLLTTLYWPGDTTMNTENDHELI